MKAFYSAVFELPLPEKHRFPMSKYRLLYDRIVANADAWAVDLQPASALTKLQLHRAHDPAYVNRVLTGTLSDMEMRRIGFPWSPELIERSSRSAGATLQASCAALSEGIAVNLAGGTHHAAYDRGQGFCVFNDVATTVREMQSRQLARRFLVIDCDVHQGNGTSEIFAQDDTVFTVSLHGDRNFPFNKTSGDIDVALKDGTSDHDYAIALRSTLGAIKPRTFDLVFYIAGADPYHGDRLGRLSLTKAGLAHRDQTVIDYCRNLGFPLSIMMAGGYAECVGDIVDIHAETVRRAALAQRIHSSSH